MRVSDLRVIGVWGEFFKGVGCQGFGKALNSKSLKPKLGLRVVGGCGILCFTYGLIVWLL